MSKLYIPPPEAEHFLWTMRDLASLVATLFKCKITIRADYKDETYSVYESDHLKDNEP